MVNFIKNYKRVFISIFATILIPAYAMADSKEYAIKSAFIYNFAKFVTWPEKNSLDKAEALIIGVYGEEDPFGDNWNDITSKTVGNKPISIRHCKKDIELASTCHILFISDASPHHVKEVISYLSKYPVLTIGDSPNFAQSGGMIGFFKRDNKIRFAINLNTCKASGLVLSSRLLKLAEIVETENGQGAE